MANLYRRFFNVVVHVLLFESCRAAGIEGRKKFLSRLSFRDALNAEKY